MDIVQGRRWTLREWIFSTQALMGLALLPVVFLDLTDDLGLITAFLLIHAVAGMICDSLAGGYFADRVGTFRVVGSSLAGIAVVVLCLAAMESLPEHPGQHWTIALFAILYLGIGLFTASSYAMFMNLTDPRLGATQFSAFMGATNGPVRPPPPCASSRWNRF